MGSCNPSGHSFQVVESTDSKDWWGRRLILVCQKCGKCREVKEGDLGGD